MPNPLTNTNKRIPEDRLCSTKEKKLKADESFQEAELPSVKYVMRSEFTTDLVEPLKTVPNFQGRIVKFKEYGTPCDGTFQFYVEWNESTQTSILIKLVSSPIFHSLALSEELFKENKNEYHFFEIYESANHIDLLVLKILFSSSGKFAELSWIQKGNQLKGNDVATIYSELEAILKPEIVYTFDDAKIQAEEISFSSRFLDLGTPSGLSWYERKFGFSLFPCENLNALKENSSYSQNLSAYEDSKNFLKKIKLSKLNIGYDREAKTAKAHIIKLWDKYLNHKQGTTVYDLLHALREKSSGDSREKNTVVLKEIQTLFKRAFSPYETHYKNQFLIQLMKQLTIFHTSQLFFKKLVEK